MIPVGNRPTIDYLVQDCIRAGITEIIFVVGEDFEQLKHYYGRNISLEEHLIGKGKQAQLDEIRKLSQGARFHYVIQDSYQPYGTSIPVHLARDFVKEGERFIVAYGDNIMYRKDGTSEIADFLGDYAAAGVASAMLTATVPHDETINYGVVAYEEVNGVRHFREIVEKPATPDDAPSDQINPGIFMFDSSILPFVSANAEAEMEGEHYITDAINDYVAAGNKIAVFDAKGKYLDCGTVQGWLEANNYILG
jgi:UTP--glucose-1-phosphate uridylyltransferase